VFKVEIEIKGSTNGKIFDERKVNFEVGEGLDIGIPRGIEFALEKMKVWIKVTLTGVIRIYYYTILYYIAKPRYY
jgi:hypothetical protein